MTKITSDTGEEIESSDHSCSGLHTNWLKPYKRDVRIAFLTLLVIAISGPWFFDRIYVPSPYTCSAPQRAAGR
jgi:hypothetical protein